jgi:hypothetical protein
MKLRAMGIDLGKTVFHLVGLSESGEVVVRKKHFSQRRRPLCNWRCTCRRRSYLDRFWESPAFSKVKAFSEGSQPKAARRMSGSA